MYLFIMPEVRVKNTVPVIPSGLETQVPQILSLVKALIKEILGKITHYTQL